MQIYKVHAPAQSQEFQPLSATNPQVIKACSSALVHLRVPITSTKLGGITPAPQITLRVIDFPAPVRGVVSATTTTRSSAQDHMRESQGKATHVLPSSICAYFWNPLEAAQNAVHFSTVMVTTVFLVPYVLGAAA